MPGLVTNLTISSQLSMVLFSYTGDKSAFYTDGSCVQWRRWHSTAQHSTAQHSTAQHSTAQHSTAQHSTAQHSTAQHSTAQHSTAQHSTVARKYRCNKMTLIIWLTLFLNKCLLNFQEFLFGAWIYFHGHAGHSSLKPRCGAYSTNIVIYLTSLVDALGLRRRHSCSTLGHSRSSPRNSCFDPTHLCSSQDPDILAQVLDMLD